MWGQKPEWVRASNHPPTGLDLALRLVFGSTHGKAMSVAQRYLEENRDIWNSEPVPWYHAGEGC